MYKRIVFVLIIIVIFFITPCCYGETEYHVLLEDDADLLTESEEELLLADMQKLLQYGNIGFKTISNNTFHSTAMFASEYYHNNFGKQSGTLFVIDMDLREVYIFSDGKNYKTITKSKALSITDNVYTYATNQQYYKCAKEVFSQVNKLLNNEKILEPMKYTSNALIAVMISIMINFFVFRKITAIREADVEDLLKESKKIVNFDIINIIPAGSRRIYSPQSSGGSDSGGGSSGGSSSGGRRKLTEEAEAIVFKN